jgi:hypothetical protein
LDLVLVAFDVLYPRFHGDLLSIDGWDIHFFRCNGRSYRAWMGSFFGVVSKLPKAHSAQISFFGLFFKDFLKYFYFGVVPRGSFFVLNFQGRRDD